MTIARRIFGSVALAAVCVSGACRGGDSLGPTATVVIDSVRITTLGPRALQVAWNPASGAATYRLARRAGLEGSFVPLLGGEPTVLRSFEDTSLTPGTFYGYRVEALSTLGLSLGYSIVAGGRTAPAPGLSITLVVSGTGALPANLTATVSGSGSPVTVPVAVGTPRVVSPLDPGTYSVVLNGLPAACSVTGGAATRSVTVTDVGATTVTPVSFSVACLDNTRGAIRVRLTASGDGSDPDGFIARIEGIATDASLPQSERAVQREVTLRAAGGDTVFVGLRPGNYVVKLLSIAANCTVTPSAAQFDNVPVVAQQTVERAFAVSCTDPDAAAKPFAVRNTWVPATAAPGSKVVLEVRYDLSAVPTQGVSVFSAVLPYPKNLVAFDSAAAGDLNTIFSYADGTDNTLGVDGVAIGAVRSRPITGTPLAARLYFTVLSTAAVGATVRSDTRIASISGGTESDRLETRTRVIEGTLTVGTAVGGGGGGGGGGTNQAPTARTGGPYTATVGAALTLSGAASSDADGTIASYAWQFGDGTTGTGATPSKAYNAAGTFNVTLTVTDNAGATGTATTTVTVSAGGGGAGNTAPIARPGGPYTGTAGTAIAFTGAASSDAEGAISGYAWNFGDGTSGTGAAPTHAYASPGTYQVTLQVTDAGGLTSTASTTATVTASAGGTQPFTWSNTFAPLANGTQVELTIVLDLSTDIPETPGAEALSGWGVVGLKWDPAVLKFFSLNIDSGAPGGTNFTNALTSGEISFSGNVATQNSTGVIQLARVRFDIIGASGTTTTTQTRLGSVLGTPATGSFSYTSRIRVVEGTYARP